MGCKGTLAAAEAAAPVLELMGKGMVGVAKGAVNFFRWMSGPSTSPEPGSKADESKGSGVASEATQNSSPAVEKKEEEAINGVNTENKIAKSEDKKPASETQVNETSGKTPFEIPTVRRSCLVRLLLPSFGLSWSRWMKSNPSGRLYGTSTLNCCLPWRQRADSVCPTSRIMRPTMPICSIWFVIAWKNVRR